MMERRERADCTVSALACVAAIGYEVAHDIAKSAGRVSGRRFHGHRVVAAAKARGIGFRKLPLVRRRTLARFLREYPVGRFYVKTRGHVLAVVDGVPADYTRPTALVYAAWMYRDGR